jgi:hypothetical protein
MDLDTENPRGTKRKASDVPLEVSAPRRIRVSSEHQSLKCVFTNSFQRLLIQMLSIRSQQARLL